jgi:imidazolonepropionase-like amidohydrolase
MEPSVPALLTRLAALALCVSMTAVKAQDAPQTLITNVHVFDGVGEQRIENANVLIEGNLIKTVSTDPIEADGATVIDGGGRTLMPGLIDAHWHTMYIGTPLEALANGDMVEVAARAVPKAEAVLMRGFTTVRDMGGAAKSGPPISQTSELLELSGPRHPYHEGPLGVIAEGAYAELILLDGNLLEDLDLVADPDANFDLIMTDGVIYKNTL